MSTSPFRNLIAGSLRHAWRLIIGLVGVTVILIGLVMIVTPGPAMIVIPVGIGILAIEFVWARRLLRRVKTTTRWKLRKLQKARPQSSHPPTDNV